ncbi:hypothetical protein HPB52_023921 [Rhipicephalus sanguineus]|uniref:Uncharacterized protein n=1 Tax=Rhipicephalus sanguineus TaxID=34632 RepID=A0A9D4QB57_RHISA|nr:hypothetical protein HPB52_023921 [Rhipicephalus sanguineus]
MERTPEDDAPSPAETSAEAIRPNPAVAGVARVSEADRVCEWLRRACNTDYLVFANFNVECLQEPLSVYFTDHKAVVVKAKRAPSSVQRSCPL